MRLPATLTVLVLTLGSAPDSTAQDFFYFPENSGQFRTASVFYDNFFQDPLGRTFHEVWADLVELRLEETVGAGGRLKAFMNVEYVHFRDLGGSPGLGGGLKRKGRSHSFEAEAGHQWNRPRSDVGDELEQANLLSGTGSYGYKVTRGLELRLLGEYRAEFLKDQETAESRFQEFGGMISYRALGGRVSPEAGLLRGARQATSPSSEYLQETVHLGVRTAAVPRVNVTVRYRQRRREYLVTDHDSKNFERLDRRKSVSASVDVSLSRHAQWSVFGVADRGESTRPGRDFVARSLGTGFTLMY